MLISRFDAATTARGIELSWNISADERVNGFASIVGATKKCRLITAQSGLVARVSARSSMVRCGHIVWYVLSVITDGDEWISQPRARAPRRIQLYRTHPTLQSLTTISFTLAERTPVTLAIYDVHGVLVRKLEGNTLDAGRHDYVWDGKNAVGNGVSSGIYFYRLTSGKQSQMKKMVLLK